MDSLTNKPIAKVEIHIKSGLTTAFLGGGKAYGSKASGRRNKRLKLKRG
jgi:hypothetical protein